jgi:hypothetical protein
MVLRFYIREDAKAFLKMVQEDLGGFLLLHEKYRSNRFKSTYKTVERMTSEEVKTIKFIEVWAKEPYWWYSHISTETVLYYLHYDKIPGLLRGVDEVFMGHCDGVSADMLCQLSNRFLDECECIAGVDFPKADIDNYKHKICDKEKEIEALRRRRERLSGQK